MLRVYSCFFKFTIHLFGEKKKFMIRWKNIKKLRLSILYQRHGQKTMFIKQKMTYMIYPNALVKLASKAVVTIVEVFGDPKLKLC